MTEIKLAPSTFAFLWEECPRCFWMEATGGQKRPRVPFPAFFTHVDSTMKRRFADGGWHSVGDGLPRFRVEHTEKMIWSSPISVPGRNVRLVIRGKFDSILLTEPAALMMADFKCAPVKPEYLHKYGRQLHAYTYATDHPGAGSPIQRMIDGLGLLVFEPSTFAHEGETAQFGGALKWVPINRNDGDFRTFLDEVAALLERAQPPAPSPHCEFCRLAADKAA
jgi:hypothetical protein